MLSLEALQLGALFLLAFAVISSYDHSIYVHDGANVLDDRQVQKETSDLGFNIALYTISSSTYARTDRFLKYLRSQEQAALYTGLPVGIETSTHTLIVDDGSTTDYVNRTVRDAFTSTLSASGSFTQAAVAAIHTLKQTHSLGFPQQQIRDLGKSVRGVLESVLGPVGTALLVGALIGFFLLLIVGVLALYWWGLKLARARGSGAPGTSP